MHLSKVASITLLSVTWVMVSDSVLHRRKMTQSLQKEINLSVDALDCLQFTTIFTTVQQKYVIIRCPEKPNHRRLNGLQSNESLRSLINAYLTGPRNNLCNVQYNSFVHKCTKKSVCKTQDTPTLYFQTISREWQLIWYTPLVYGQRRLVYFKVRICTLQLDYIRWGSGTTRHSALNAKFINFSVGPKYSSTGHYWHQFLHGCVSMSLPP